MRNTDIVEMTDELLVEGSTSRLVGSWTKEQLFDILGLDEKSKGWKERLIGNWYEQWQIDEFLAIGKERQGINAAEYKKPKPEIDSDHEEARMEWLNALERDTYNEE